MPKRRPIDKANKSDRTNRTNRTNKTNRTHATSRAAIKVIGVGGGGGNAVSRMKEMSIRGVEFIAINTDVQDLDFCDAHKKLAIGKVATRGLGTGMNPELGRQAAEENKAEIADVLGGADLVFITAGLGGGTGSGASAVVAEIAKELGALTVAVVTKPFAFEGGQRAKIAEEALLKLKEKVDTYIVIPNDRIFAVISKDTSINKAFEAVDGILRGAVQGIAELIALTGLINVDFADVKTIMQNSGSALVGVGAASGKERGVSAVRQILSSPLLEVAIDGARGILFGISGGRDLKMAEVNDIAKIITENADAAAKIIFGAYHDRKVGKGALKVTLIATGFGASGRPRENGQIEFEVKTNPLFSTKEVGSGRLEVGDEKIDRANKIDGANKSDRTDRADGTNGANKSDRTDRTDRTKKKPTEIWDIPAFLRRGKK